jgi:hypothetical protein
MISSLLRLLILGLVGLVVLGVGMTVLGIAVGLAALLLKLAIPVAIGYVVIKMLSPKRKQISEEDRKWLEGH